MSRFQNWLEQRHADRARRYAATHHANSAVTTMRVALNDAGQPVFVATAAPSRALRALRAVKDTRATPDHHGGSERRETGEQQ